MTDARWLTFKLATRRARGAVLIAATVIATPLLAKGPSALENVACWFNVGPDWPRTSCHYVRVPERHGVPDSPVIRFPVVRFSPEQVAGAPVLHLGGGGPGQAYGLEPDRADANLFQGYSYMSLAWDRELIVMDPRGVGMAKPLLGCPEVAKEVPGAYAERRSVADDEAISARLSDACFARLRSDGVEPGAYHSRAVAADVEAMRKALGVAQWNLYGVSYASRYALTIAREYPDTVAAMVLDGPVFPQVRYIQKAPLDFETAFSRAFARCQQFPACARRFADIETRFWRVVDALEKQPIEMSITHPRTYEKLTFVLTGARLVRAFFTALYDEAFTAALPEVVASLENRNVDLVAPALRAWLGQLMDPSFADAAAFAHFCVEEHPFIDYDVALANAKKTRPVLASLSTADLEQRRAGCEARGIPPGPAVEGLAVRTAVPTLVLHGGLDPVLPVEDLHAAMKFFANGVPLVFDEVAHDVVGSNPCAEEAAGAFFEFGLDFKAEVECLN